MKKNDAAMMRPKLLILLTALFLLLGIGVKATVSFLSSETVPLINVFSSGEVKTEVVEDFNENIKENVQIRNTGNIPAYVRAAVIINWVDLAGNTSGKAPQSGVDYMIVWPEDSSWFLKDDLYYYSFPVEPDGLTTHLISSVEPMAHKEGYTLSVEILGSGIQSMPGDAVEESWPVTVDPGNGKLIGGGT